MSSSEEKAREEMQRLGPRDGAFFWQILRTEVDGPPGKILTVHDGALERPRAAEDPRHRP